MQKNYIIAGVGGQGILSMAAIIDVTAMNSGLYVKQAEVHGMSQRGGSVEAHLRISDTEIFSDIIPLGEADCIIATEPMEALRYIPFLKEHGTTITASKSLINCANYPDKEVLDKELQSKIHCITIDADAIALSCGSIKTSNIVILGAASNYLGIDEAQYIQAIKTLFASKGTDIVNMNICAFSKGREYKN